MKMLNTVTTAFGKLAYWLYYQFQLKNNTKLTMQDTRQKLTVKDLISTG